MFYINEQASYVEQSYELMNLVRWLISCLKEKNMNIQQIIENAHGVRDEIWGINDGTWEDVAHDLDKLIDVILKMLGEHLKIEEGEGSN